MGYLRRLLSIGETPVVEAALEASQSETFAVDETAIDPAVFGLSSYSSPTAPAAKIDRRSAEQVPAVTACHDLIAGTLGGLPLDRIGPDHTRSEWSLFEQPERNVPRSVTMTRLFGDLFYDEIAWWRVTERRFDGYPAFVKRLDPRVVTVQDNGDVYVNGAHVPDSDLIRFDSPVGGLLRVGARAIRTALALETAAANYAAEPMPQGYISDDDLLGDDELTAVMQKWHEQRQSNVTAYLGPGLKYNTVQFSPEQLQLADARDHAVKEIARLAGIGAEELGVAVTSRTYFNAQDRRKSFLDFTLGKYRAAVEDRLSMGDVTHRGYRAKLNLSAFLRATDLERMQVYQLGLQVGAITPVEVRELEDRPALSDADLAYVMRSLGVQQTPAQGAPALRSVPSQESA